MLRKERRSVVRKNKDIHASQREIPSCDKAYEIVFSEAHFHFDEAFSEDQLRIQFSCH